MQTKIRKIGNSAGVTFNKEVMEQSGFAEGQLVTVAVQAGLISITSAEQRIDIALSLNEAQALATGEPSPVAVAARQKIREQIDRQLKPTKKGSPK